MSPCAPSNKAIPDCRALVLTVMLEAQVLWALQAYIKAFDLIRCIWLIQVVRLGYSAAQSRPKTALERFHLALRLNESALLSQSSLEQLLRHVKEHYGITHLTLIKGGRGFERLDLTGPQLEGANVCYNYEPALESAANGGGLKLNLLSTEAESLFRAHLVETAQLSDALAPEVVAKEACRSFTAFPPIDMYICMNRCFSLDSLHPLHLGFTHF
jgi:hypothetical protein